MCSNRLQPVFASFAELQQDAFRVVQQLLVQYPMLQDLDLEGGRHPTQLDLS